MSRRRATASAKSLRASASQAVMDDDEDDDIFARRSSRNLVSGGGGGTPGRMRLSSLKDTTAGLRSSATSSRGRMTASDLRSSMPASDLRSSMPASDFRSSMPAQSLRRVRSGNNHEALLGLDEDFDRDNNDGRTKTRIRSVGRPAAINRRTQSVDSVGMDRNLSQDFYDHPQRQNLRENHTNVNQSVVRKLVREGFPTGLALALCASTSIYQERIWVVDNSGSMQLEDGQKMNGSKSIRCTRWEEIKDTVYFHGQLAGTLNSPTTFKLLNDPGKGSQTLSVGAVGMEHIKDELNTLNQTLNDIEPDGVTPLASHVWDIKENVEVMASELVQGGKQVAIILATDGLPTDENGFCGNMITDDFVRSLQSVAGGSLPVWVVIRLCTSEPAIRDYYNNLDQNKELKIDVLDDYVSEAAEVNTHNKWLTYGLPLHRCRELGYHDPLFDLIDERALTTGELTDFCVLIFGEKNMETVPDPVRNWSGFAKGIKGLLSKEESVWNPVKKKMTPWFDMKILAKEYSGKSSLFKSMIR